MNAIPTHYNGIDFRSRLEAKWARFFDLLGWPYEYEPIDLSGYIPDFVLKFAKMPIYVEIKPSMTIKDLESDCQKARLATIGKRLLCLGGSCELPSEYTEFAFGIQAVRLNLCDEEYAELWIEIFGKGNPNHEEWDVSDPSTEMCIIGHMSESEIRECKECGLFHPNCDGYNFCPNCGYHSKGRSFEEYLSAKKHAMTAWKEATNTTQYNRIFYAGKD